MSATKNKLEVFEIDCIDEHIIHEVPDEYIRSGPKLREAVEQWEKGMDGTPFPLSVSK